MGRIMFGVVLWSDPEENKAVIWCEDHGDLAFYRQNEGDIAVPLDAGDWVQFDLSTDRHLRFAHNPRLISEGISPDIAGVLRAAAPAPPPAGAAAQAPRGSAEIIPFAMPDTRRKSAGERGAAAHRA